MNSLKVMPLLIVVVMLAFSVRLAEVVTGFSSLSGSAQAEAPAEKPKTETAKAEEKPAAEEKTAEKKEESEKPAEAAHGEPAKEGEEAKTAEAPVKPEEAEEWHDAEDSDTEFSTVRHELYDNLAERRTQLDKRETDLVAREALLRAAEQELERKFNELSQLRGEIEKLLNQQSEEEKQRIVSLVKIYEGMKPKDAARIFDTLDLDVLMSVMGSMSERKLSPILAEMSAERAKTITIMLAEQKQLPQLPSN